MNYTITCAVGQGGFFMHIGKYPIVLLMTSPPPHFRGTDHMPQVNSR